ncbi:hypothetical protein Rsub_00145 [Raphidocelis subcapitata]|uniref:SET domain-containing protein n=1 Tax=Raphidocelis subcapitata TaxID=307507 RepID=A0A2V0NJM9_9CHLO|nr:hypothetical protein Rsub_00145 [Raphidocelis subcapitata]|eukprot:GBF87434.1 hypothetical protein Rsub_00145 [Raphidocelis subcapitata]
MKGSLPFFAPPAAACRHKQLQLQARPRCAAPGALRRGQAARGAAARSTAPAPAAAAAAAAAPAAESADLYARLVRFASDGVHPPLVAVAELPGAGGGRGLVAAADAEPGAVLLSVPFDRVFASAPEEELADGLHWAAEMGLRLLQARHACRGGGGGGGGGEWGPWIEALPSRVVTPAEFSATEAERCGVPSTIQEIAAMQSSLEEGYRELAPQLEAVGCGRADLLWAVQVLHSRCFYEANLGLHLSVPGVDMANDGGAAANATVKVVHSPDASQGAAALEDIAPPPPPGAGRSGSLFQLVAGAGGVAAGEEVRIAYGWAAGWPAEPYFLMFGFVPEGNPAESVVAYSDLQDLARHFCSHFAAQIGGGGGAGGPDELWERVAARAEEAAAAAADGEGAGGGGFERLVVTAQGLDQRLGPALGLVRAAAEAEAGARLSGLPLGGLIADRLRQLRRALGGGGAGVGAGSSSGGTSGSTSGNGSGIGGVGGERDGGGERGGEGCEERAALIEAYRRAKLGVVDAALAAMGGGGGGSPGG